MQHVITHFTIDLLSNIKKVDLFAENKVFKLRFELLDIRLTLIIQVFTCGSYILIFLLLSYFLIGIQLSHLQW